MKSALSLEMTPSHHILPTEAPDIVGQRQAVCDITPCLNTCLTESVNGIKW